MVEPGGRRSSTLTVLFTDGVGSTALLSRHGPEVADDLRQTVDAIVRRAVATHGGEEVKHTGDGLMVVFGSSADAVSAACALQRSVARARGRDPRIHELRVGMAAGEAVHEEGDWFGPPVIEAARLCADAQPGQVLATSVVALLVGSRGGHAFTPLGDRLLKGFDEPTAVVEVTWLEDRGFAIPLPAAASAPTSGQLVGRSEALGVLRHAWKRAQAGERQLVAVSGEPGIGKTRLVAALAGEVHDAGGVVLWGRCDEELGVAYQPFLEALRQLVVSLSDDELATLSPRDDLARLLPELRDRALALGEPRANDPDVERLALFDAVTDLLRGLADEVPVLLVLDDLHWALGPALLLLRHLIRSPETARIMVAATYRDTELDRTHSLAGALADLRERDQLTRLKLDGLDGDAVAELVEHSTGAALDATGLEVAALVHAETSGNPFFIGQVVRHLVESGAIRQEAGRWAVPGSLHQLGIPEGVKEVVGRRLSRLSLGANRVLSVAAVIGSEFDLSLLGSLPDVGSEDELLDGLDAAVVARLIREVEAPPGRYGFVHALVRQTLLAELTMARRARLHRRIGEVLARTPGAEPAFVAHHLCAGATAGDLGPAIDWSLRASDEANDNLAWEEAVRIADRALEVLELAESPDRANRSRLCLQRARAFFQAGDIDISKDESLRAAHEAEAAGDAALFVEAAISRIGWGTTATPDPEGVAALRRAFDIVPDDDLRSQSLLMSSLAFYEQVNESRGPETQQLARRAVELARRSGDPDALGVALTNLSFTLLASSAVDEHLAIIQELTSAVNRIEISGYREDDSARLRNGVVVHLQRGDRATVESHVAAFTVRHVGRWHQPFVPMWNATLALMSGDIAGADDANNVLAGLMGQDVNFVNSWAAQLAYIRMEQGRVQELIPILQEAVSQTPGLVGLRALLAASKAESGDLAGSGELFADLVADRAAIVPRDIIWSAALAQLATVCGHLGDHSAAPMLHDFLEPFDGQLLVVAWGVACAGAAARHLGVLEAILGDHEAADGHFAAAIDLEERAGAPALAARSRLWWARSLLARPDAGAACRDRARVLLDDCARFAIEHDLVGLAASASTLDLELRGA